MCLSYLLGGCERKLIYSVLHVDGARWNVYKANIYGYYDEFPVKSGSLNWSENLNFKLGRIDISAYESEVD